FRPHSSKLVEYRDAVLLLCRKPQFCVAQGEPFRPAVPCRSRSGALAVCGAPGCSSRNTSRFEISTREEKCMLSIWGRLRRSRSDARAKWLCPCFVRERGAKRGKTG